MIIGLQLTLAVGMAAGHQVDQALLSYPHEPPHNDSRKPQRKLRQHTAGEEWQTSGRT